MRVGESDALGIFEKWLTEKAWLLCHFAFQQFHAALRGHIYEIADHKINLKSDDGHSELSLVLRPEMDYGYGDPRKFPDEADKYECVLIVYFSAVTANNNPDYIAFTELKK